ncbi:MAG: CvpA family protein [Oscillospiraceae bacterium]
MKIAIDLILLVIIILSVWAGYKKGLIMGIGGMVAIIVSLYAGCLLSTAFSYELIPVARPFASGYVERQMKNSVLDSLGLADTELSVDDVLAQDPEKQHEFCFYCYRAMGIYKDAAEQMATEAEKYADENGTDIASAVVEVLCARVTYVAGVVLFFLVILITLTAIGNIPNLSFKIPNMDILNDAGGAVMGLIKGITFCVLLCWALRFAGIFIGKDTLEHTLLARFFIAIDFITMGIGI